MIATVERVADAKLYTDKTALTAADMLNDRVLPWYERRKGYQYFVFLQIVGQNIREI